MYLESIQTPKDGDYKPQKVKQKKRKLKKSTPKNDMKEGAESRIDASNDQGATLQPNETGQVKKQKRKRQRKPCDCGGGGSHFNKNYSQCKYNPNNNETMVQISSDNVTTPITTDRVDIDKPT